MRGGGPTEPKIALTGATGLLGSELLRRLLTWNPGCRLALLTRTRGGHDARARVRKLLAELLGEDGAEAAESRVETYECDLAAPSLGLAAAEYARLRDGLTSIHHLAAEVRFDLSPEQARAANVESTARLLELAESAGPDFGHFHYVSTYAACARAQEGEVSEDAPPLPPGARARNSYERSKADAEALVLSRADRVPVSVHRVSIVGGDSRTGWTSKFDTFYTAVRIFLTSGAKGPIPVPRRGRIDMVPVDFAADALYVLGRRRLASGSIHHVTAGQRATPIAEALRHGARRLSLEQARAGRPAAPVPEFVEVERLDDATVARALGGAMSEDARGLLEQLTRLLPYAFDEVTYSNQRLLAQLAGTRVRLRPLHESLDAVISYAVRSDWGAGPGERRPPLGPDPLELPEPVAVVGTGCVLPGAPGVEAFWQRLVECRSAIERAEPEPWEEHVSGRFGAYVKDPGFDAREFRIPPAAARSMDRLQKMVLVAAREALGGVRLPDPARVGAVLGYGGSQLECDYLSGCRPAWSLFRHSLDSELAAAGVPPAEREELRAELEGVLVGEVPPITEDTLPGSLPNVAAGRIMSHFDFKGPSFVAAAGDCSGLAAVGQALDLLRTGECDAVVTGAAHALLDPVTRASLVAEGRLSASGEVKPFAPDAAGTVPGEGAVLFVLKRLGDARRDGDRILGVLHGLGRAGDGRETAVDGASAGALVQAMREAASEAGIEPTRVDYVETHGSSIPWEDAAEARALREVFASEAPRLGAAKANFGHLGGAGGALGLLKALLVLRNRQTVPEAASVTALEGAAPGGLVWAGVSALGGWGQAYHLLVSADGGGLPEGPYARVSLEPVAIVGLGAVLPAGAGVEPAWSALLSGRQWVQPLPGEQWEGCPAAFYDPDPETADRTYGKLGALAPVPAVDLRALGIPPATYSRMDRSQKQFLAAATEAMEQAGRQARAALIVGESKGGMQASWKMVRRIAFARFRQALLDSERVRERWGWPRPRVEALVDRIESPLFDGEPAISEDSRAGSVFVSALARLAKAADVRGGHLAVDAACASSLAALASALRELRLGRRDWVLTGGVGVSVNPIYNISFARCRALSAQGSRPFDALADGIVLGEGSALFALKRLSQAQRDGDRIQGVILAVGASSDGRGHSMMAPDSSGQRLALERALEAASCAPQSVQAVECHATGTRVGDESELEAVAQAYQTASRSEPLWVGSVKSQIGHTIGAAGAAGLFKCVQGLRTGVMAPTPLASVPHPALGLESRGFRLADRPEPWPEPAPGARRRAAVSAFGFGGTNWHLIAEEPPRERRRPARGRSVAGEAVALLFPGHGSPYPGLGDELLERSTVFRKTFDEADEIMRPLLGISLREVQESEDRLLRTDWVQPLIVASDIAFYRALRGLGLEAGAFLGHSVGQFSAAAAAGMITFEEALRAAHGRGQIFRQAQLEGRDTGAMSAVFAPEAAVRAALAESGLRALWIANVNCPSQTVVSGATAEVAAFEERLRREGQEARRLPISVGWHTPLARELGSAAAARVFGELRVRAPRVAVLCNVDGTYYQPGESEEGVRPRFVNRLVEQIGSPMDFPALVRRLYADGARVFVESGPRATLSSFATEILGALPHRAFPCNRPKRPAHAELRAAVRGALEPFPEARRP